MSTVRIIEHPTHGTMVERFRPIRRVEHIILILTFVTLALTGLPQKFYDMSWAATLLGWFGGLDQVRDIHRWSGLLFSVHGGVHLLAIVIGAVTGTMKLSLLPRLQDLKDARMTLDYYFGRRDRQPDLPVFDYRHKFEYMGIVLGGLVMVFSGLILMYPLETVSMLPGELIPAARVTHSNEAMLAMLVLAVWHLYGSHLAPEVFPAETTIFTGYMSVEELRHKHRVEYDRLVREGHLKVEEPTEE